MYELSEFLAMCKKHRLNPVLLKNVFGLRIRGYNNVEISEKTGINKNTVNKYILKLKQFSDEDIQLLINY
jgi:Fic family protein